MAITKLNSLAIPDNTIVEADLSYPLTNFSSTGIDDNATSSTAITIDSNQKVGINESVPTARLHVQETQTSGTNLQVARFENNASNLYIRCKDGADTNSDWEFFLGGSEGLIFSPGASEKMRIDASGNLLVGYTSDTSGGATPRIAGKGFATKQGFNGALRSNNFNFAWTGALQAWIDTTNVGNVSLSSDYRIKRNIESMSEPALARIAQLRPVTYQPASFRNLFEESDEVKEGFIAHELQEIIPSAVDGEKDSEDQIQSLKVDALCAVLTKAIQEQQTIIDSQASAIADLTTRLEALEAN